MAKKRGIYHAVQYYRHPVTGEVLFDDDMLAVASKHKCIKKCYYIIHDEDTYKQSDIDRAKERLKKEYINRQNEFVNEEDGTVSISCDAYVEQEMATTYSYIKIGEKKPKHIHIVIFTGKSAIDTADLALWFGIPENLIDIIPKGRGNKAFYDCLLYLTHESAQAVKDGKYKYSREDVGCFGEEALGFDEELAEYEKMMEEYGQVLSEEDAMRMDVLLKGKTPEQCAKENPLLYAKLRGELKNLYGDYLESLPQPAYRLNFYIDGTGGEGKWQFMVALARSLFPGIRDSDLYFKVGGKNVSFEGYTGQPIVIWDDFRAISLIQVFGDRGKFFDAFNTFPEQDSKQREHVKFAHTNLVNSVNIVNSVEPWDKFLDGLAGEYKDKEGNQHEAEDKKQPYRRFPMIFRLHMEDYDIMINKGFLEGTKEFFQYITYEHIRGNFYKIADACKQNGILRREVASRYIEPAIEQIRCLEDTVTKQKMSDDEIRERFSDCGYNFDLLYDEAKKEDEERMKPQLLQKYCEVNNANRARFRETALTMWRFKQGDFDKEPSTDKEIEEVEGMTTILSGKFWAEHKIHDKWKNLLGIEENRMPKGEAELLVEANIIKMLLDEEEARAREEEPNADMVAEFEESNE